MVPNTLLPVIECSLTSSLNIPGTLVLSILDTIPGLKEEGSQLWKFLNPTFWLRYPFSGRDATIGGSFSWNFDLVWTIQSTFL